MAIRHLKRCVAKSDQSQIANNRLVHHDGHTLPSLALHGDAHDGKV